MKSRSKWTENAAFCEWLCAVQYAQRVDGSLEVRPFLSLGVVLYLHEAFEAGRQAEQKQPGC